MPFRFDADRRLVRIVADAARIDRLAGVAERPWCRTGAGESLDRTAPPPPIPGRTTSGSRAAPIAAAIEAAVVGDADQLGAVLTSDAVGWSPAFVFGSRREAVATADDLGTTLEVVRFAIVRLVLDDQVAVAEWQAAVVLGSALLVGDDLLVEPSVRPTEIHGVSIAGLRGERIASITTYFDDSRLIEAILLDR